MNILTLDLIRLHTRIDSTTEDTVLELYGQAAEDTVLNLLDRTLEDLYTEYGTIPAPIQQACLMLCDHSYAQRSPASPQALYAVPYTLDALIKPYMAL